MKRRTVLALVLVGVALSLATPAVGNLLSGGKDVGENVRFEKSNGPNVTVGNSFNFTTENPWKTSNQITLQPYANFSSNGETEVRAEQINGSWTNLTQLEVVSADLSISVNDKQTVVIGGDADRLAYTDMSVDDGVADFEYAGQSGSTTLTIHDLPASTTVAAVDMDTSNVLDTTTTNAAGTAAFSSLPNSEHTVALQTTSGGPTIDDSSLTPNTTMSSVDDLDSISLQANVSDPDFPSDEINVSFYVEGSYVGSDTLQSAGTASVTISRNIANEYSWHAEAEDAYGQTDTSNSAQFLVANELSVYNESSPQTLIQSGPNTTVEVTIRFYGPDDLVVERTTTDGTINMSGLPADRAFVVIARADGYHDRRIYIEGLMNQQSIFLLPDSTATVYNVFTLVDRSGSYEPGSTRLIIRRALNTTSSSGLRWTTISGDYFGATNEHETYLRFERRYRLIIENQDGDRRVIGSYMASDEQNPKQIVIREIVIDPPNGTDYYGTAWMDDESESDGNSTVWFSYSDPSNETSQLTATIHERGNESNVLATVSQTDVSSFAWNREVPDSTAWVVNWTADRNGETIHQTLPVGNKGSFPLPMDPVWLNRFILVFLPITAALASERVATLGALSLVAITGMLMLLQWYNVNPALWMGALVIALGGHALAISGNRGPLG